ncbi:hypothetical protein KCH33_26180, partial [Klebsiella pneumoniae]|nr:hypothetical protein [Klebsiella pneumoniae]
DRLDQVLVLQQRDLEFEDLSSFAAGAGGKIGDLPADEIDRLAQRERLLDQRAGHPLAARARIDPDQRTMGKADRGGPAAVSRSCSAALHASL